MLNSILPLMLLITTAEPETDKELYRSFVQCAAFHKVEAYKSAMASDAQNALSEDFLKVAKYRVPNGDPAAAEADVKGMAKEYQSIISKGDPAQMAQDWTALESACKELYRVKDGLLGRPIGAEEQR
jgi:hypothetical protein